MKIVSVFLSLGIMVVFAAFILVGVDVFYPIPIPRIDDYMPKSCVAQYDCEKIWEKCTLVPEAEMKIKEQAAVSSASAPSVAPAIAPPPLVCNQAENNQEYQQCIIDQNDCRATYLFELPQYNYFRNVFYIYMAIVLMAIVGSMYLLRLGSIGSGILGGGIIIFIFAAVQTYEYWWAWNRFVKLAILGIILAVLIFVAYKKIEKILAQNINKE